MNRLQKSRYRVPAWIVCMGIASLCLTQISCEKKTVGLEKYPDVQAIFTEAEIRDLNTILGFFETQICDLMQVYGDSTKHCYPPFFQNVASVDATGVMYVPVPFHAQLEMYKQLSPTAFTEIWLRGTAVDQVTRDTSYRMSLSFEGKYMQFLDSLVTDYQIIDSYRQALKSSRHISRPMIETVLYNGPQYNINDLRMRLFVAMHYLTLNDTYERKNNAG